MDLEGKIGLGKSPFIIAFLFLQFILPAVALCDEPVPPAFELANAGKTCSESQSGNSVDCDFKVGNDLHFSIVGLGQPDVKVVFFNSSIEGDYFASFSLLEGCVVVKHGKKGLSSPQELRKVMNDVAHISPKDGNVYRTWEACLDSWHVGSDDKVSKP
jgi:hypothetical protein